MWQPLSVSVQTRLPLSVDASVRPLPPVQTPLAQSAAVNPDVREPARSSFRRGRGASGPSAGGVRAACAVFPAIPARVGAPATPAGPAILVRAGPSCPYDPGASGGAGVAAPATPEWAAGADTAAAATPVRSCLRRGSLTRRPLRRGGDTGSHHLLRVAPLLDRPPPFALPRMHASRPQSSLKKIQVSRGWSLRQLDVQNAFLH
ncbi:uncharacterized protein [Miscanthus floridulus]|uniref:uncharacterized protein n=1 Tax=Miscanthus floridulus TaxID=154761 RepID=UPI00345A3A03